MRKLLFISLMAIALIVGPTVREAQGAANPAMAIHEGRDVLHRDGVAASGAWGHWFIIDSYQPWTAQEVALVLRVMEDTVGALGTAGIDGRHLLRGYRFRRQRVEFIGVNSKEETVIAYVDHERQEIVLSDRAFTLQRGFYIYHELGHAVDRRLGRELTAGFHARSGGAKVGGKWRTANDYWIRQQGRDDATEAAADAFAVWIFTEVAGMRRPVFSGATMSTDYKAISATAEATLRQLAPATPGTD